MTQLDTLKKVLNNRTLAICYHGRSLTILEERIQELKGADICWAGINDFWVYEKHILAKIDKQFDIIMCSAKENLVPDKPHVEFLNRQEDNLIILDQDSIHPSQVEKNFSNPLRQVTVVDFKTCHQNKLLFFTADRSPKALNRPEKEHPLHFLAQVSFSVLIALGIIGGARRIILFGTEGVNAKDDSTFPEYPKRNQGGHGQSDRQRKIYDTGLFKETMPQILRNICVAHDSVMPPIVHCGEKSYYGTFPVWSYDQCFAVIKNEIQ